MLCFETNFQMITFDKDSRKTRLKKYRRAHVSFWHISKYIQYQKEFE